MSVVDGDVVDSGHAQEGNCANGPGGDRMALVEIGWPWCRIAYSRKPISDRQNKARH
jgi:hypothetical protein